MADDKLRVQISLEVDSKDKNIVKKEIDKLKKELEASLNIKMNVESKKLLDTEKSILQAKERTAIVSQKQADIDRIKISNLQKQATIENESLRKQEQKLALMKKEAQMSIENISTGKYKGSVDTEKLSGISSGIGSLNVKSDSDAISKMKDYNMQLKEVAHNSKLASIGSQTFGDTLKNNISKFSEWMVASTLFYGVVASIQSGITQVSEMDRALTDLKKTTDETDVSYKNFISDSYTLASSISATAVEIVDATSVFTRMGYTLQESFKLAELATILTNVGDGFTDVSDTSDSLNAILKGFNLTAMSTEHIINALNKVGNDFAITSADGAQSLKRVSAVMAQTGVTFDQTMGIFVGGQEIMQNWEVVSRGMLTVSNRIRSMKDESGNLIPTMKEAFDVMKIDMSKPNGELKNMYELLGEIKTALPTLTDRQREFALQTIAGKDQVKVLTSILSNYDNVLKATEASQNSFGSAMEEQATYADSIKGKLTKLSNTWSEFWNNALNSSVIKAVVDGLTSILQVVSDLTKTTSGLAPVLIIATTALMAFKNTTIGTAIIGWIANLFGFKLAMDASNTSIIAVSSSAKGATISMGMLNLAMGGLLAVVAIGSSLWQTHNRQLQEAEDYTLKVAKAQENLNTIMASGNVGEMEIAVSDISKLSDEFTKATSKVIELTTAMKQLAPTSGQSYDNSEKYAKLAKDLQSTKELTVELKKKLAETFGIAPTEVENMLKRINAQINIQNGLTGNTTAKYALLNEQLNATTGKYEEVDSALKELASSGTLTQASINTLNGLFGNFTETTKLSKEAMIAFLNSKKTSIKEWISAEISLTNSTIANTKVRISALQIEMKAWDDLIKKQQSTGEEPTITPDFLKNRSQVKSYISELGELEIYKNSLINSGTAISNVDKGDDKKKKGSSTPTTASQNEIAITKERYAELNIELSKVNNTLELNKALQENATTLSAKNKLIALEIELLKKKQVAIHNIAMENRKERDEIKSKLSKGGVAFTGVGDSATSKNAQDVINKKLAEVNAHRFDKDRKNFNQLKEDLSTLQADYSRFIELQVTEIPKAVKEWTGLQGEIYKETQGVKKSIDDLAEETIKKNKEVAESQLKDTQDLYKDLADALEKQDERETQVRKDAIKKRITQVEYELDELERLYNKASEKIEEDDINKKISDLQKERMMRSIEGSLDANARIYEIDKELVDLNKTLTEQQRKAKYNSEKQSLEDKKKLAEKEIDKEEESLKERQRLQEYYAQARVMIEGNSMSSIVSLLQTYNSAFALDGASKGQAWLDEFKAKVLLASQYLLSVPNVLPQSGGGSSSSSSSSSSSGSSTNASGGRDVQVGKDGKAPAGLVMGDKVKTAGGDYLITGGEYGNYKTIKLETHHDGVEGGLVGGVPMPKQFEQLAKLAKGEMVLNQPQMQNLSNLLPTFRNNTPTQNSNNMPITLNLNAVINNELDIKSASKQLAVETQRELLKRGLRL